MVTPFDASGDVDYGAAVGIGERLIETDRADSIILSGTTGEFHLMTLQERVELFRVMAQAVGSRIPLIAGIGAASTREALEIGRRAQELGIGLVMVVSPYYGRPCQREIYSHFESIAGALQVPVMLYNIPLFTGVNIAPETLGRLAEIDNIVGIKEEAELAPKQITEFINSTREDFTIYCGDDAMIIESYAAGGSRRVGGTVTGGGQLIGDRIRDMIDTFASGDVETAARLQQSFLPLFRALSPGDRTNPVPLLKDAMNLEGFKAGLPRLPFLPGTEEEIAGLKRVMQSLDLI
jgi:4-hydroxy-tetrahydrodipicolinate synthase